MKYPCPSCEKENEPSGMCNSGDWQILCNDCKIMYDQEGVVDVFLTEIVRLPKEESDEK